MTAVLLRAWTELRARRASMLAVTILLGLSAGAVTTLAAGARRTDSAYDRFARDYKSADVLVFPQFDESFAALDFDKVAALPQVVASGRSRFVGATAADGRNLNVISADATLGRTIDRVKVLDGNLPATSSMDSAALSFTLADALRLRVGSRLPVRFGLIDGEPIDLTLRVVGIVAAPGEFPPQLAADTPGQGPTVRISNALYTSLKSRHAFALDFLLLRLRHGSRDLGDLNNELNDLAAGRPQINQNLAAQAGNVRRSIHLQAVALWIVAGLIALVELFVLSQVIARQAALDAVDIPVLQALGMTRAQITLAGMSRLAIAGVAGAAIGAAGAVAASPLMPIGTARIAEPAPGVFVDVLVVAGGAAAMLAALIVLAGWSFWRTTDQRVREMAPAARPSLASRSASVAGVPPTVGLGMRLALETGSGRTRVPVRTSLSSVVVAIVALCAALTFGAALDHLLATPHQYGWNWDVHATDVGQNVQAGPALKALDKDAEIESVALMGNPPVRIGNVAFDVMALEQYRGVVEPVLLSGRAPRAGDEIALGAKTLRDIHAHIGSTVQMSIAALSGGKATFKVVGTAVIPPSSDTTRLGTGAVITLVGMKAMVPPDFGELPPTNDLFIRFVPGVDQRRAVAKVEALLGPDYAVLTPSRPVDLVNFGHVQNLPLLLAGLVALLAAATLAHTLVSSIRRRRRDLVIVKVLGLAPGQVRSVVAWQATSFVSMALLVGIPLGIVVGHFVWAIFARQLGTLAEPATPVRALMLTIPGAVLLANLIAAAPGVIAGRMKPAPVLRAE